VGRISATHFGAWSRAPGSVRRRSCETEGLRPRSTILLYNGGRDQDLLRRGFPLRSETGRRLFHPTPTAARLGLHSTTFARDRIRFALRGATSRSIRDGGDSDQIATRPGYSHRPSPGSGDRPRLGLIASGPRPPAPRRDHPGRSSRLEGYPLAAPSAALPGRGIEVVHWSSGRESSPARRPWTSRRLVDGDPYLREIMGRGSGLWATEEVILPTWSRWIGYEGRRGRVRRGLSPYRSHTRRGRSRGPGGAHVYWIHPVIRRYGGRTGAAG